MDPITQQQALAAAGAAGGESLYVDDVFSTYVYTGNGTSQTITNGIDLSGEGGMVWCKPRSGSWTDEIVDTERGVNSRLAAISTAAATSSSEITSFNSDGYTLGYITGNQNFNGADLVSWTFRKAPGFFDVVTWTGDGSSTGQVISHNLGSTPGFIVIKETNGTAWWACWHRSLGGARIFLNDTSASTTANIQLYFGNGTSYVAPTDSSFTVNSNDLNQSGNTYVAYIFAHDDAQFGTNEDESIIKCGSYTGNASGVDLNLGFEPQWVMIKRASGTASAYTNWYMFDNMRGVVTGGTDTPLAANLNTQENGTYLYGTGNPANLIEFSSTGIRVDPGGSQFTAVNTASEDYIYIAIRRPHKPPEAATDVFAADKEVSPFYSKTFTSGFPVDLTVTTLTSATSSKYWLNRVTGTSDRLVSNSTAAAFTGQDNGDFDRMDGWYESIGIGGDAISWMFRRAPGFFDVVAYTGTGAVQNVNHNLEAVPELMIVKSRNNTYNWRIYASTPGPTAAFTFTIGTPTVSSVFWNDTSPTASVFTLGTSNNVNFASGTYIAYLFATLPGISKVGSYTGTGIGLDVDCGFTAGARFVMVKRTDSGPGSWYVWDATRGIVSGNDPYFRMESTDAEVTSYDYIDPINSGFRLTIAAPAAIDTSGGTYIFLAIA